MTTIDPVVDVVGLFEVEPGLLRINKDYGWLRAADVMAEGDADIAAAIAAGTHAIVEARREAWRLEESLWAAGRVGGQRRRDARPRPRAARSGPRRWSTGASSSASPCPTAVRPGGPATRPTRPSARRASQPSRRGPTDARLTLRPSARPSSPAGGTHEEEDHGDDVEPDAST